MSYPSDVYVTPEFYPPLVVQWDGDSGWDCRAEDEELRPRGHGATPEAAVEDYKRDYDRRIDLLFTICERHGHEEGYEAIREEMLDLAHRRKQRRP